MTDVEGALGNSTTTNAGVLCVTLGERGAVALDGDRLHDQPAFPVDVRDTTGAGDVFGAGSSMVTVGLAAAAYSEVRVCRCGRQLHSSRRARWCTLLEDVEQVLNKSAVAGTSGVGVGIGSRQLASRRSQSSGSE